MNRGKGIEGLDDKLSGMEILMTDAFAKISPTDPLILAKQVERRKPGEGTRKRRGGRRKKEENKIVRMLNRLI